MDVLIAIGIVTLINLAALYIEWRDSRLKYQRVGQAMVALELRIAELERARTNAALATLKEFNRLDERITALDAYTASFIRVDITELTERIAQLEQQP